MGMAATMRANPKAPATRRNVTVFVAGSYWTKPESAVGAGLAAGPVPALSGAAAAGCSAGAGAVDPYVLTGALTEVCGSLAEQMARDAEGATKFVQVRVVGARSGADARIAARAVANSQLVQCSLNGNDPYWGRVLSELGASGAYLDPERVDISYNGVDVCRDGVACAFDGGALTRALAAHDVEIRCDLRQAHGAATVLTTDLSHAYIDENRRTS